MHIFIKINIVYIEFSNIHGFRPLQECHRMFLSWDLRELECVSHVWSLKIPISRSWSPHGQALFMACRQLSLCPNLVQKKREIKLSGVPAYKDTNPVMNPCSHNLNQYSFPPKCQSQNNITLEVQVFPQEFWEDTNIQSIQHHLSLGKIKIK